MKSTDPADPASLRRVLTQARELERVRGEQAWQFSAAPFSAALLVPVFADSPWRLRSFAAGMALAAVLWIALKLLAARAARRAGALERALAAVEGVQGPRDTECHPME